MRRETVKTKLLAAAAALSLGVGSAYADGGDGPQTNFYTVHPDAAARTPVQNAPAAASAQSGQGQATHVYVTRSDRGTWLFGPNGGSNSQTRS